MKKFTYQPFKFCFTLLIVCTSILSCSEEPKEPINGTDGTNGQDGVNGTNGFNSLVILKDEPVGTNCSTGGVKVTVGQDGNNNGTLEESEILSSSFICNGSNTSDAPKLLAKTSAENPGNNCTSGGTLVEIGTDLNDNNILDDNEVQTSFYVCNGKDGANGSNGGADGLTSLIRVQASSSCSNGGITVDTGLDNNKNGTLESNEISTTHDICNGADGTNGSDGRNLIVVSNTDIISCPNGGVELTFGYDDDNNGTIDQSLETVLICSGTNGQNGLNSIIASTPENSGTNCPNGGTFIQVGIDDNRNNLIDASEVDASFYVCNGQDGSDGINGSNGKTSLIKVSNESAGLNCSRGGLKIQSGIDDNGNNLLDLGEVDATSFVCDGRNGTNGSDGSSDNIFEFYFQEEFNQYTGTIDLSIEGTNPNLGQYGSSMMVARGGNEENMVTNSLLLFPKLNEVISERVKDPEFKIVEAILYIRSIPDGKVPNSENWIGVKTLSSSAPLLKDNIANWNTSDGSTRWKTPGAAKTEEGGANGYSDMFRLPSGFDFDGTIPLLINKDEVESWVEENERNKGMVLTMVNNSAIYDISFHSSSSEKVSLRPVLYLKVQTGIKNRSSNESHHEAKREWDAMSYEEKIAPLKRRN